MSYGSFVAASMDERRQRHGTATRQRIAAAEWVAKELPDLSGDPFAAYAALRLKAEGQPVTASSVRKRRGEHRMPCGRTLREVERSES